MIEKKEISVRDWNWECMFSLLLDIRKVRDEWGSNIWGDFSWECMSSD